MNMVKEITLNDFFEKNKKLALAFSGGTDSAYLMYMAKKAGVDISAYYVISQFQPEFEQDDARRLADELGCRLVCIDVDILSNEDVASNPENRCYYCKKTMFAAIVQAARSDGYEMIIDGTNASDQADDRPGMRALEEAMICSPLRLCGITKSDVRELSKAAGLWTWDKPSYACLATRIKTGERITSESVNKVEANEEILRSMGYRDFRIRVSGDCARLELRGEDLEKGIRDREEIIKTLNKTYSRVLLDPEEE